MDINECLTSDVRYVWITSIDRECTGRRAQAGDNAARRGSKIVDLGWARWITGRVFLIFSLRRRERDEFVSKTVRLNIKTLFTLVAASGSLA